MAQPAVHDWGEAPASRPSPLACRYHGFLIGHTLALGFEADAAAGDVTPRLALETSLRDLGIPDVALPEPPADRVPACSGALAAILPRLAQVSRDLAEFAVLGGLLARYTSAIRAGAGPAVTGALGVEIERLRGAHDLPPFDPQLHAAAGHDDVDDRVAPALRYLAELVVDLAAERETALLLMPAAPAFEVLHAGFHAPALAHGGYRRIRAWGGLGAASAELMLAVLGRVGLCWADVSDGDPAIVTALGAAQALEVPTLIVARADAAVPLPRHVGCDAVIRYDPRSADWPEGPALLMAACLAGVTLIADRGDRLCLSPGSVEDAFDAVSAALGRALLPPAAREAHRRGRRALDAGDLALAEASFDEAWRLGLHDDETQLWRGWARLGLGRFADAAADLDAVVGPDTPSRPAGEWRPIAAYLRAVLREAQGDLSGALRDVDLALALGLADPDVRDKRDALAARLTARAAGPSASRA